MGINRVLGIFSGCSGGGNIQKIHQGIDPDEKKSFQKIDFLKIKFFLIFGLLAYISTYFGIAIKRAMKKHVYCLIFTIYG